MSSELRNWLQRTPHPVKVRGKTRDGEEKLVRIGETRSRWRDAEVSLRHCVSAEALDASGEVLRTWESPEEEAAQEATTRSSGGGQLQATVNLVELGRVISEAADLSAQRHAEAYRLSFEQLVFIVKMVVERLAAFEAAWNKMYDDLAQEARRGAPTGDDPNAGLVASLIPQVLAQLGTLGGPQQHPPNGRPNGT